MVPLPLAGFLGIDFSRQQVLGLGLTAVGVVVGFFLLLWLSRTLRRHGQPGSGLLLFTALIYLPLLGIYVAGSLLGLTRFTTNPEQEAAGGLPIYDTYGHAEALLFILLVLGIYIAVTFLDGITFTKERESRLAWKVPKILREVLRWTVVAAGAIVAASAIWNIELRNITIFTTAVSVAATIALGPTLGSLISGITLTMERPFEIGDWIEVEGKQGRVDQITWRSTRIVTRDSESVVFPNGKLAEWRIINLSRPENRIRIRTYVGVHYRTPPHVVREAILHAVQGTPGILERPEPVARVKEYADSSVHWEILFWIEDPESLENIRADVLQRVWYSFDRAGIEIPFPIRNLIMREKGWERTAVPEAADEEARRRRNEEMFRKVPILQGLPEADLAFVASRARDEVYLDGERVTRQNEPGDRMFVIVQGKVRVAVEVRGLRDVAELKEGDFFGEMSLLTGCPRAATVIAIGTLRVVSIRAEDLRPVLQKRPEIARNMAEFAASRKIQIDELSARVEARGPTRDIETTSSNLLQEILRYFKLPGDAGRK